MEINELLCATVKTNKCELTEILLKSDVDVNYIDSAKKFPLYHAYENNMITQMKMLLENKANVNQLYNGLSILNHECKKLNPNSEIITLLMDNGADPNLIIPDSGAINCTLKILAGKSDTKYLSILLLYPQTNIDLHDLQSVTPFRFACANFYDISAIMLLDKGCDCNISACEKNLTPLMRCIEVKNTVLTSILISHPSVKLDLQDINGNSALHHACNLDDLFSIYQLLSYGANQSIKNKHGKTAFECCQTDKSKNMFTYVANRLSATEDKKDILSDKKISPIVPEKPAICFETTSKTYRIKYGYIGSKYQIQDKVFGRWSNEKNVPNWAPNIKCEYSDEKMTHHVIKSDTKTFRVRFSYIYDEDKNVKGGLYE